MSDTYAVDRFREAVDAFRALEGPLRADVGKVDPRRIDAVLIDLDAAIPGLSGEEFGRALVFRAYAFHWRLVAENPIGTCSR